MAYPFCGKTLYVQTNNPERVLLSRVLTFYASLLRIPLIMEVIVMQKSAGGVLLPKSSVKFERYLMGEVSR